MLQEVRKMKHDIEHLKASWKKFRWWCKMNEIKCLLIMFYVAITVMTIGIVNCPM